MHSVENNNQLEIENLCHIIFNRLNNINSQFFGSDSNEISLSKCCIDFETKWNIGTNIKDLSRMNGDNMKNLFQFLRPKILRKFKKCVVFGRTSSGKSTFINALLSQRVLPASCGSTSNSFVVIQASANNTNYLMVDDEIRTIEDMRFLNNLHSPDRLNDGSTINLFYNKETCKLLDEDVILVDTPGLDAVADLDRTIEEHCLDADMIILMVNGIQGLSLSETGILNRFTNILSVLKVMIVFNFWDIVTDEDEAPELVKTQLTQQAKTLLVNILNFNQAEANENIYFISAKESLNISNNISDHLAPHLSEHNASFNNLFNNLKREMAENSMIRRHKYLLELFTSVSDIKVIFQEFIRGLNTDMFVRLQNTINSMSDINVQIDTLAVNINNESFEDFLAKGIKISNTNPTSSITNNQLTELLIDVIDKMVSKLQLEILKLINNEDILQTNILTELYYNFLRDLKNKTNLFDMSQAQRHFQTIIECINKWTTAGLGASVVVGGVMFDVAAGGSEIECINKCTTAGLGIARKVNRVVVEGAARLLFTNPKLISGLVIGSCAVSKRSPDFFWILKFPFRFAWKESESNIRAIWNSSFETRFSIFSENLMPHISRLTSSMVEQSNRIQNELNEIEGDLTCLRNIH